MKEKIIEILKSTGREGIENLIAHMEKIGFFEAACSSQYHLAKPGGLAEHSLNVYNFGNSYIHLEGLKIDSKSWAIVSLLHDLGKASYRDKQNYVVNYLKNGMPSTDKPYTVNKDRLPVPHETVSVIVATQFISLTEEEEFAILGHNGLYTSFGKDVSGKERPLQITLHFADMFCSRFLEGGCD